MPIYMFQRCYTWAAIAAMVKAPEDRTEVVRSAAEGLGGKLIGCWMAFGDYDYVGICEFPDSQAAADFAMATSAGGSLQNTKTVELITFPDAMKANEARQRRQVPAAGEDEQVTLPNKN